VELLTAILFVLAYFYIGLNWNLLEALIFIFSLVCCTFIDFDHMILPDQFTLSGIIIGLLGAWLNPERNFMDAIFGVLLGGGFLWAMAYFYYLYTKIRK
jgi:leader peptidase (prepilin peptidase)/N-methyltransferase